MDNNKRYNVVLGIMIFLFIIVIGVALAWGIGYIGVKTSDGEFDDQNKLNTENVLTNNNLMTGQEESKVIETNES